MNAGPWPHTCKVSWSLWESSQGFPQQSRSLPCPSALASLAEVHSTQTPGGALATIADGRCLW